MIRFFCCCFFFYQHTTQVTSVSAQVLANPRAARTHYHQDQAAKQDEGRGPGAAGSHGVPPV